MTQISVSRIFGASLLIAGTSIGAGMLGLPMVTAAAGFLPSLAFMLVCWVLMIFTALALVEVSRLHPLQTNFSELAKLVSRPVQWVVNLSYLSLFYSLMAAYTAGGAGLLQDVLSSISGREFSMPWVTLFFTSIFIFIVFWGVRWVDRLNRLFMAGLILSFLMLMWVVSPHVTVHELVNEGNVVYLGASFTIIATSFGFHHLMPSIRAYLKDDYSAIRIATVIGSFIPLCVYVAWEVMVIGSVPTDGPLGLMAMSAHSNGAVALVKTLDLAHHSFIVKISAEIFSILALLSSLVGVALGLSDYLKSALSLNNTLRVRVLLMGLTFVPSALYALIYPEGFIFALSNGGLFGAILLIIFPALLYLFCIKKSQGSSLIKRVLAYLSIVLGVVIIGAHLASLNDWLPTAAVAVN